MSIQIKLRRDTYANWTSVNHVLAEGEIGLVTNFADNNKRIKIGDGVTAWEDLDYFTTSQDLSNYVTDAELASALSNYIPTSRTVNGKALSSNISIDKTDVGLGSVDNTSDANKPISTATQTALDLKQDEAIVISSNQTAVNDEVYHNVATATYTDPSPVEGKGFTVFVRNGTATVGGTAYATAGTIIKRTFHSGAWLNKEFIDKAQLDSTYQVALGYTPVTNARTITINGTTLDLSANRSWTVGDVTTNSAASLTSLTITGTAGAGFLSLINQSSAPSAVNGTVRLFANSSSNLTWVRRNNANSADIRRTLIAPDIDIDYTLPTPATGSSSTLAGLNTVQTWTHQQTFTGGIDCNGNLYALRLTGRSGTAGPDIASAPNILTSIRIGGVFNSITYLNEYSQPASGTNGLTLETSTQTGATGFIGALIIRSGGVNNSSNSNNGANIQMYTREILAGTGASGSILLDVGLTTAGVDGAGTKAGIALFNRMTSPNWQGGQRIMFIGNRTSAPTGNPVGGYFNYAESGNPVFRTSGGAIINLTSTTGWGTPTGTLTRTTFATYVGATADLVYNQTIMQNLIDSVKINSERLAALISDLKTVNGFLSA